MTYSMRPQPQKDEAPERANARGLRGRHNGKEVNAPLCHHDLLGSSAEGYHAFGTRGSLLRFNLLSECRNDDDIKTTGGPCERVPEGAPRPPRARAPALALDTEPLAAR
jgi:hypothetical protein